MRRSHPSNKPGVTPRQCRKEIEADLARSEMENVMTEATTNPALRTFTLDEAVKSGDTVLIPAGTVITVRKPGSGELRGLTLMALSQLDVTALHTLAPRITTPPIAKGAVMDPADLMQFGGEVMDFLLPKAAKAMADSPTT
ncbi:hypothetical protein QE363_000754 [Sphingomonas sp. SORGH_AS870]|nr:hypothetical protein [Sphingomonas sp. SORGH_AS_0870]